MVEIQLETIFNAYVYGGEKYMGYQDENQLTRQKCICRFFHSYVLQLGHSYHKRDIYYCFMRACEVCL